MPFTISGIETQTNEGLRQMHFLNVKPPPIQQYTTSVTFHIIEKKLFLLLKIKGT